MFAVGFSIAFLFLSGVFRVGSLSRARALYVKEFPLTGSTHCPDITMNFIRSMVERVEGFDESVWTKVDAKMQ